MELPLKSMHGVGIRAGIALAHVLRYTEKNRGIEVFRVQRSDRNRGVCLTLEGELRSKNVAAAESACHEALSNHDRVTVVIKNVSEIDEDGYAFLERLVTTKAQVRAIGIFSKYVLEIIRTGRPARR
jgi:ABC-type transporter Mla MlaB component